jgi:hypothetical protein
MAIADMWIDIMKLHDDYAWGMGHIVHTLTNRRYTPIMLPSVFQYVTALSFEPLWRAVQACMFSLLR